MRNSKLEVIFEPESGLPYSYSYRGRRLWGEDEGRPVEAVVCRLEPREYRTVPLHPLSMRQTAHDVVFTFRAEYAGRPAATLGLRYLLDTASLKVTMESVTEQSGFQLIELALPQMVTVRQEDGPAWMAEGRNGGSFVKLESAKPYRFPENEYFGRIST